MDVMQDKLKVLLRQSDIAFENFKCHPHSLTCADAYQLAKEALDEHIHLMHIAIEARMR